MDNKYDIKTLEDILRCVTVENVDDFVQDFKMFIGMWTATKTLIEANAPDTLETTLKSVTFKWIDDGKHDAKVNIEVIQE